MSAMAVPVWRLALADLAQEWRGSLVTVLAVTVALAPPLILFGLWFGVVETMRARLAADPANLELRPAPLAGLPQGWFETAAARADVGFVLPRTRYVNLQVAMINREEGGGRADVVLAPTAPGDPVLAFGELDAPQGDAVVLSARAAEALGVGPGGTATLVLARIAGTGARERVALPLTVRGVLPIAAEGAVRAFAPLPVLLAIQNYQEWVRVPERGWPGGDPRGDTWGGFRLYARSIGDVEGLRRWLAGQGIEVQSAAGRIAFVERVNRDLGLLFSAILGLALTGYATTVALTQLAVVARKRRVLAILRLLGYGARSVGWFPVIQGAVLALGGALCALMVYQGMEPLIGALFRDLVETDGRLMRLPAGHAAAALVASVALAGLASLVAGRRAMRISPAESLRDV